MRKLAAYERAEVLEKASEALVESSEDLARTISSEAGKPIKFSRRETKRAFITLKFASEEAKRITGETSRSMVSLGVFSVLVTGSEFQLELSRRSLRSMILLI